MDFLNHYGVQSFGLLHFILLGYIHIYLRTISLHLGSSDISLALSLRIFIYDPFGLLNDLLCYLPSHLFLTVLCRLGIMYVTTFLLFAASGFLMAFLLATYEFPFTSLLGAHLLYWSIMSEPQK